MKFLERYINWQAQKPVKRSLLHTYLISLMSLCLCVCMLLGTTMAWFTSGVEVPENEIYVGTLDVDLLLKNAEGENVSLKWNPDSKAEQPRVFGGENAVDWYPGYVETRTFTVENKGEIPFTYKLSFTADPAEVMAPYALYAGEMTEEELVAAFLDSFLVYNKVCNDEGFRKEDLMNPGKWECIGTLAQICDGGITVFSGESEKMKVPGAEENAPEAQAQQAPAYPFAEHTIAVQMKEDAKDDFQGFKLNFSIKLVANQLGTPEQVATEEQLLAALSSGRSVVLTEDLELGQNIVLNNTMINGDSKTLEVLQSTGNDCAITTTGGTIRNLTILGVGGNQAIGSGCSGETIQTQNLYIDNVEIDSFLYALYGKGDGTCKVVVTNSKLHGGIDYDNVTSVDFVSCIISESGTSYASMRICGNTGFTDCTFDQFALTLKNGIAEGSTISFTNCSFQGDGEQTVAVTAENVASLFGADISEALVDQPSSCTILVDGVKVDTSGWASAN